MSYGQELINDVKLHTSEVFTEAVNMSFAATAHLGAETLLDLYDANSAELPFEAGGYRAVEQSLEGETVLALNAIHALVSARRSTFQEQASVSSIRLGEAKVLIEVAPIEVVNAVVAAQQHIARMTRGTYLLSHVAE